MPIHPNINTFIGYGNNAPAIRFLGFEERLIFHENMQEADSLLLQIVAREAFNQTMDLQVAVEKLLGFHLWHGQANRPRIQRTFLGMIAIMIGILSANNGIIDGEIFRNNELQRRYQSERLGRTEGVTLLTELFPLPLRAHNQNHWQPLYTERYGINNFNDYLTSGDVQQRHAILRASTTPVTICYGKGHWRDFKNLFQDITWIQNGSIEYGTNNQTQAFVVLTEHFTAHGNLYGRLSEVVRCVLSNGPNLHNHLAADHRWLLTALDLI